MLLILMDFIGKELRGYTIMLHFSDFDFYKKARFSHYAHKSDILQLLILQILARLFSDIDTFSIGSIEPLINPTKDVLRLERNPVTFVILGIWNAIL